MDFGTLTRRHPRCTVDLFDRYDAMYRGGEAFKRLLPKFLLKNPLESNGTYALRQKSAEYRSYVGPVADFFAAQLFSAPFHVRAGEGGETEAPDEFYAQFREDTDGNGTDLATFMKDKFLTALVKGTAYWVAELPDDGEGDPSSKAEWRSRGLGRARIVDVPPECVLDWEVDGSGQRTWAITHKREQRRDNPRTKREVVTQTWKLYDETTVETFQIEHPPTRPPRDEDPVPSLGSKSHGFLRVPLVEMRLPDGLWLLARASDAQVEHFRLSVAMSWAIQRTCYPMLIFKSDDKDGAAPSAAAGVVASIGSDEEYAWVSPPTAAFDVLSKEIYAQMTEIYRVAQQMSHAMNTSAAALDRSGDSKAADNAATEICLHAYATHVKAAIEDTYELVSDGRGDVDVHFSIEGMTQFNLDDRTGMVNNIRNVQTLNIESPTLKKELNFKLAELTLPDADQPTKDKIREELEEAAKKPTPAPPPVVGQPPPSGQVPAAVLKPQPTAA